MSSFFYSTKTEFISPIIGPTAIDFESEDIDQYSSDMCMYGDHLHEEMSAAWDIMTSTGKIKGTDKELQQYIHNGLVDLILHEVGHTLGLRHNFKASSIYSIEQLSSSLFTKKYGISGSVMDYQPVNIFDGTTFFQKKTGNL